jgi:anaerobic magnesium-protoporphyrin IX monomethyl ester cyclase
MTDVVLINPSPRRVVERWDRPDYPHIGLGYLGAVLRRCGNRVVVIDAKLGRLTPDAVVARLREWPSQCTSGRPPVVGLTAMTHEIDVAGELAAQVRTVLPEALIVVGGVHATARLADTLRDYPAFDVAVAGEGERRLSALAAAWSTPDQPDLAGIPGLAWRSGSEIVVNPPAQRLSPAELDALPFPAWDLFPPARTYPVMSVRGCPFPCIFCARPYGTQPRARSPENVVAEFRWLAERWREPYIKVYDETFGINARQAAAVLDGLDALGGRGRIRWWAQTRVSIATETLLARMAKAGCDHLGIGIESGNPEILRTIDKDIDLDKARRLVRAARQEGIKTEGFYIIGLPGETPKTVWDTIRFAASLRTDLVSFGLMVPYPDTVVYDMARRGEGGYRLLSTNWSTFNKQLGGALEIDTLSRAEMERLQAVAYVYFFLRTGRVLEFLRFCWANRSEALAFMKHFARRIVRPPRPVVPESS